ncbi:MAG TPA: flagellar biosynthesis anti-sigma factor FlgM [Sphingomonas sp.]|nr:flagellar biosynthesis anti-sigma factor FlgM [Sphingomonas sp.]
MINGISTGTGALIDATRHSGAQPIATGAASSAVKAAAPEDRAAVSTTIASLVAAGAPIDGDRIQALRAAIRAGSYRPDPQAIAGRMIDGDLAGAAL